MFEKHFQFSSLEAIPLQFPQAILFLKHSLPDRTSWPCQSQLHQIFSCVLRQAAAEPPCRHDEKQGKTEKIK